MIITATVYYNERDARAAVLYLTSLLARVCVR